MSKSILIFVVLCLFLSCARETVHHRLRPAKGGRFYGGVYRMNMVRGNPNGLDPVIISSKLADDIALQIYDRLISFDSNLSIQPELATRWEVSDNGREYRFHLRTDVTFQDDACFPGGVGRTMRAQDVQFSFNRCCDPRTRSVAFWVFKDKVVGASEYFHSIEAGGAADATENVSGIQCADDSTLVVRLHKPYAPFLMQLSNALGCVVPREAIDYYGKDFFRHPVGTGAFRMSSWKDDHEMLLVRNQRYWKVDEDGNRQPYLDTIRISFITDDKVQFQEFMSTNLDESFTIPTEMFSVLFDPETKLARKKYDFVIQQRPAMLSWFIDFLCTKAPFNDVNVRRAFAYAVDREKLVHYVLRNAPYAAAVHGITPPVMPGYSIDSIPGFSYQPQLAQEYLAKAGFPHGEGFPEVTLSVYSEPRLMQVAEAVQNMLSQTLNIKVKIQVLQFAQLLDMAESGKLTFWGTRWYGDYPDVENYLSLWDGSLVPTDSTQPSYPNSTRYNNPEMNSLLSQAVQSTDERSRLELYARAETRASMDAPSIMLFYEMHYRLMQPYVRNNALDPLNRVQLKEVWFAW